MKPKNWPCPDSDCQKKSEHPSGQRQPQVQGQRLRQSSATSPNAVANQSIRQCRRRSMESKMVRGDYCLHLPIYLSHCSLPTYRTYPTYRTDWSSQPKKALSTPKDPKPCYSKARNSCPSRACVCLCDENLLSPISMQFPGSHAYVIPKSFCKVS